MYDPTTTSLIQGVPTVQGFDSARLPELLTGCYALISTVRLRLNTGDGQADSELMGAFAQLRSLALALEIHAALSQVPEERTSAAFVSATAHQLMSKARDLVSSAVVTPLALEPSGVPSEIASGLLFLAAGFPADASEMVASIRQLDDADPRVPLLSSLIDLCAGRLVPILGRELVIPDGLESELRAELTLLRRILQALRVLALRLLNSPQRSAGRMDRFRMLLEEVRSMSVRQVQLPDQFAEFGNVFSMFSGAHHLATLLLAAGSGLDGRALLDISDPTGPGPADWGRFIGRRVRSRPFLWTNHRDAIGQGLLDEGTSAAISFPTGAGKSTLSELKIAAAVLAGRKVVYLAPTLALVGQVSRNLRTVLSEAQIGEDEVEDQLFVLVEEALTRSVSVMTPERCLLLLTLFPESFEDLGLIVFDECHSLHMAEGSASNRPVSGMLSLLRLIELAPEADVLLMSAMMRNGSELAGWLKDTFGKQAVAFDADWKPTRQARGSVVFERREIEAAKSLIPRTRGTIPQSRLFAKPFALVSLQQTWKSNSLSDYRLLSLADSRTKLKGGRTSYGNPKVDVDTSACAVSIAAAAAQKGLKTIVFFHNQSSVSPAVQAVRGDVGLVLQDDERELFDAASIELGGDEFVFTPNAVGGGHYGDLLREERTLVESAFTRSEGCKILFSTNTLAQGMNLPADLVIIVRTGTYRVETDSYENVEVHDLLNAAGRAGRAGHAANGMVLVIPDKTVDFNAQGQVSGWGLGHLKDGILAQDDRCLDIADPIEVLLDGLSTDEGFDPDVMKYLLLRLPPSGAGEASDARARAFFAKSFAAYRAAQAGRQDDFESKVGMAFERRVAELGGAQSDVEALSSATGLTPSIIDRVIARAAAIEDPSSMGSLSWGQWLLELAEEMDDLRGYLLKSSFKGRQPIPLERITASLELWLGGAPLTELETALSPERRNFQSLTNARRFALRISREIAYAVGLVAQIAGASSIERRESVSLSASNAALLIRDGFISIDVWVLLQSNRSNGWTRVKAHREAAQWLRYVESANVEIETVAESFDRVSKGIRKFRELSSG